MNNTKEKVLRCINCPFYSGIECHGHGEFYATCKMVENLMKSIELYFGLQFPYYLTLKDKKGFDTILDDSSTCIFFDLHTYGKEVK